MVFGEAAKKFLADDKGENRVAEKLHLLVIRRIHSRASRSTLRLHFPRIGGVGERLLQQVAAPEAMPESILQQRKVMRIELHSRLVMSGLTTSAATHAKGYNIQFTLPQCGAAGGVVFDGWVVVA